MVTNHPEWTKDELTRHLPLAEEQILYEKAECIRTPDFTAELKPDDEVGIMLEEVVQCSNRPAFLGLEEVRFLISL